MLRGLPASGKTTFAKELVEKGWKRVNKDDLRAMIDDSKWSKDKEKNIIEARDLLIIQYLDEGFNVVVDDTNFHPSHKESLLEIAENCDAEFEVQYFDVPLLVCIKRDLKRGSKSVGEKVIMRMYEKYCVPEPVPYQDDLEDCYIFDIDGTLAKMDGRNPHDYTMVHTDVENTAVVLIQKILQLGTRIIIMSGRDSICRKDTEQWLEDNEIKYDELHMRHEGDNRNDIIVKKEFYDEYVKDKYNVLAVFDDRDRVVQMWRSLGITCLQCGYGNF